MRKKFIVMAAFAAMFGMAFTSCSNDDDASDASGHGVPGIAETRAISFNAHLDGAALTRGMNASLADIVTDGISVWAFDATKETAITTAADFFMGGPTAGLAHSWVADPGYYKAAADYFWPEYALNFVALTPQSGGGIGAITCAQAAKVEETLQKPVMTVAVDVPLTTEDAGTYGADTQHDIMFASLENQAPLATGSAALSFKHGLSQLVFKGGVDAQSTIHKAVVKSIKLVNVASDGTLTYTAATDEIAASGQGSQTKTYAANIVNTDVTAKIGKADPAQDETPNAITGWDNNNTVAPVEAGDPGVRNYQMMIMPQTSVECTGVGAQGLNVSQKTVPTAGTYLLVNADLYANGDNLLHPITFTAEISNWATGNKNVEF